MKHLAACAVLLLISCSGSPTPPTNRNLALRLRDAALRLDVSASRTQLRVGTPDTIRMTLTNDSPLEIVLYFGDSCQLLGYVRDARGAVVLPEGGFRGCLTVVTELALAGGQSVTQEFVWNGITRYPLSMPAHPLPAGIYYASGEVVAGRDTLRSAPVAITLSP